MIAFSWGLFTVLHCGNLVNVVGYNITVRVNEKSCRLVKGYVKSVMIAVIIKECLPKSSFMSATLFSRAIRNILNIHDGAISELIRY